MRCVALSALIVLTTLGVSCGEAEPPPPVRPAADLAVAPGLSIVCEVSDSLLFSGAAVQGESATPLFRGRLTARSNRGLSAPAGAPGTAVRLRFAPAPALQRGEEMSWIKSGAEAGSELSKSGETAEFVYSGGQVIARVGRDESGKLVVTAGAEDQK